MRDDDGAQLLSIRAGCDRLESLFHPPPHVVVRLAPWTRRLRIVSPPHVVFGIIAADVAISAALPRPERDLAKSVEHADLEAGCIGNRLCRRDRASQRRA